MKVVVLSSSSKGNCTYLEIEKKKFIIDIGISSKSFFQRLKESEIYLDHIDGVFISHEHSDHISGLSALAKKYDCPIYMSKQTFKSLPEKIKEIVSLLNFNFFVPNQEFLIKNISVFPFRTSHDAIDPVGFVFKEQSGKKMVYLTDTGTVDICDEIVNAECYIMESNHEPEILLLSARPWSLKSRIMSEFGHLSNEKSAMFFSKIMGKNTRTVILFHLSNECNTKELALLSYKSYFKKNKLSLDNIDVIVSEPNKPTKMVLI